MFIAGKNAACQQGTWMANQEDKSSKNSEPRNIRH